MRDPKKQKDSVRVTARLSREELAYLDRVARDARASGGRKLSRTEIVRAMIRAARNLDIPMQGLKTVEELEQRILKEMGR